MNRLFFPSSGFIFAAVCIAFIWIIAANGSDSCDNSVFRCRFGETCFEYNHKSDCDGQTERGDQNCNKAAIRRICLKVNNICEATKRAVRSTDRRIIETESSHHILLASTAGHCSRKYVNDGNVCTDHSECSAVHGGLALCCYHRCIHVQNIPCVRSFFQEVDRFCSDQELQHLVIGDGQVSSTPGITSKRNVPTASLKPGLTSTTIAINASSTPRMPLTTSSPTATTGSDFQFHGNSVPVLSICKPGAICGVMTTTMTSMTSTTTTTIATTPTGCVAGKLALAENTLPEATYVILNPGEIRTGVHQPLYQTNHVHVTKIIVNRLAQEIIHIKFNKVDRQAGFETVTLRYYLSVANLVPVRFPTSSVISAATPPGTFNTVVPTYAVVSFFAKPV